MNPDLLACVVLFARTRVALPSEAWLGIFRGLPSYLLNVMLSLLIDADDGAGSFRFDFSGKRVGNWRNRAPSLIPLRLTVVESCLIGLAATKAGLQPAGIQTRACHPQTRLRHRSRFAGASSQIGRAHV